MASNGWRLAVALALVAHAHADIHEELEEAFLIFQHIAPERRVVQRYSAMHQGPGGAVVEVRWHVFELAFGDTALDQQGQALEVGGADLVQLLDHLRYLIALDHLLFQAVEQAVALRVAHTEFEVGARQRFLVAVNVGRMQQFVQIALVVEHQAQVNLGLGLEVLVDGAFANPHGVGDHLDRDAILALFKEEFQRDIENLLLAAAKFTDLSGFFLHRKRLRRSKIEAAYYAYLVPNCTDHQTMYAFHDEFKQEPGLRYLNHAAVAPWPRRASVAVAQFAEQNVLLGARDYADWMNVEQRLRERFMRLLNAPSSDDIALVKNTSEALSFVAFGLDWQPGQQIIISDEEFPSNRIVWEALAALGVEVVQVSLSGPDPEQNLLAACGPKTRLMAISAVQFASGLSLDLNTLGHGCRQRGVLLCVDAIQQLGAQPFDVQANQCDFAMADGHKWLLGPEGLGVFYCRAELREQLKLHEYGWHMLERMGDYTRTDWEPARSARRFECGSPNMLGAMALEASLSLLEDVGMPQVTAQIEERMVLLQHGLQRLGATLHSPLDPDRRAGIFTFSLGGWDNQALFARLKEQQIVCAQR